MSSQIIVKDGQGQFWRVSEYEPPNQNYWKAFPVKQIEGRWRGAETSLRKSIHLVFVEGGDV